MKAGEVLEPTVVETHVENGGRVLQLVFHILRGVLRMTFRVVLQEIHEGMEANSEDRTVKGWRFFLVPPQMRSCIR